MNTNDIIYDFLGTVVTMDWHDADELERAIAGFCLRSKISQDQLLDALLASGAIKLTHVIGFGTKHEFIARCWDYLNAAKKRGEKGPWDRSHWL